MNVIDFNHRSFKCKILSVFILLLIFLFVSVLSTNAQQVSDTAYRFSIYQAAYQEGEGSLIYIDEAHNNFQTKGGFFFAFSKLLEQDGYRVKRQNEAIMNADMLNACKILVIANPLHVSNINRWTLPTPSAFSTDEISNIKQWVENGGSLFLIADHMPFGILNFLAEHYSKQPDTAWRFNDNTPIQKLDGFYQGAILTFGKGNVAVFGEAAMFTAQIVNGNVNVGFNSEYAPQNAQFTLNLIHWLDGIKDYSGTIAKEKKTDN